MSLDFEKLMKNKNITDKIRTPCNAHEDFKITLETIDERSFWNTISKRCPFLSGRPCMLRRDPKVFICSTNFCEK